MENGSQVGEAVWFRVMPQGQLQLSLRLCFLLARLVFDKGTAVSADLHFSSHSKRKRNFQKSSAVEFLKKSCGIFFFIKRKNRRFFLLFSGKSKKNLLTKQVEWSIMNTSKGDQRIAK